MTSENVVTFIKNLDQLRSLILGLELAYTNGNQDKYVRYREKVLNQIKNSPKSVDGVTAIQDIVGV